MPRIKLSVLVSIYSLTALAIMAGLSFAFSQAESAIEQQAAAQIALTEVSNEAAKLRQLLTDRETGQRGYLVTNDPKFLQPYLEAEVKISEAVEALTDELDRSQIDQLSALIDKQARHLDETIQLAIDGDHQQAIALVATGRGKEIMDEIRTVLRDVLDKYSSEAKLAERSFRLQVDSLHSRTFYAVLLLTLLFLIPSFFISRLFGKPLARLANMLREFSEEKLVQVQGVSSSIVEIQDFSDQLVGSTKLIKDSAEEASRLNLLLKETEAKLIESNARLSKRVDELDEMTRIFNLTQHIAQIGSFTTDLRTDQQWFTETLKEIFDYQPEEHFDRDIWLSHIHPDDADRIQAITAEIFANRNFVKQVLNYRIATKSGELKHVEVTWDYAFDEGEDPTEINGYVQDVSKVHDAAQRERLARIELEEVARKRSQLFGMVAHELRTPVAAISMMTDEHDTEEWQNDRQAIKRTVGDLLNTIDDMRLLINPELVRPVRPEDFTVSDLNGAIASSVASIVAATGVQYQQYNALAMPLIDDEFNADTYRVRVAVTNIVKNACLHSRGSQVWMVSRMYTDQGEDFLEWLVAGG